MGKKGKNTAKKKAARQESKAAEKTDRELKRGLPARLDALLARGQEEETKDIDLFAKPPPQEVCPICEHPNSPEVLGGGLSHSLVEVCGYSSSMVYSCCGKEICRGCIYASQLATDKINRRKTKNKEPTLLYTCPFCREPGPKSEKEDLERFRKRAALNDGISCFALALMHRNGVGIPKDDVKALDLFCHAAELGVAGAYRQIGVIYRLGEVSKRMKAKQSNSLRLQQRKGTSCLDTT